MNHPKHGPGGMAAMLLAATALTSAAALASATALTNAAAGAEQVGKKQAAKLPDWNAYRAQTLQDTSLVRYYTFENIADSRATVTNLAGKDGALRHMDRRAKPGEPPATEPRAVPGRWPGKTAIYLDRCSLVGDPFQVAMTSLTVECWVRFKGLGSILLEYGDGGTLVSSGSGYQDGWRLLASPVQHPSIGFQLGKPGGATSASHLGNAAVFTDGKWHHLAATWNGGTIRVFLDGRQIANAPHPAGMTLPSAGFVLGYTGYGAGSIAIELDEVAIYARALPPAEIEQRAKSE